MSVYIRCFVEGFYGHWERRFPEYKSQIEWVNDNSVYWRGQGGGFAMKKTSHDDSYVYFQKVGSNDLYRISLGDYLRLASKASWTTLQNPYDY